MLKNCDTLPAFQIENPSSDPRAASHGWACQQYLFFIQFHDPSLYVIIGLHILPAGFTGNTTATEAVCVPHACRAYIHIVNIRV